LPTRSVYLDEETDRLASELMQATGAKLSALFHEFLLRMKAVQGMAGHLAIVQDCSTLRMSADGDPYRFETWVDQKNTRKVLLMGVTMRDALVHHAEVWENLLGNGAAIHVLLQGDLDSDESETTRVLARMRLDNGQRLVERKERANAVLKQLSELASTRPGVLEVRQTGQRLLTYSAVMIWKHSPMGEVEGQIHPYFPNYDYNRGPRFIVSTSESSRSFAALMKPIDDLWATSETVDFASAIAR